jgi:hypothetical protein
MYVTDNAALSLCMLAAALVLKGTTTCTRVKGDTQTYLQQKNTIL